MNRQPLPKSTPQPLLRSRIFWMAFVCLPYVLLSAIHADLPNPFLVILYAPVGLIASIMVALDWVLSLLVSSCQLEDKNAFLLAAIGNLIFWPLFGTFVWNLPSLSDRLVRSASIILMSYIGLTLIGLCLLESEPGH